MLKTTSYRTGVSPLGRRLACAVRDSSGTPSHTASTLLEVLLATFRADGGALFITDPSTTLFSGGAVANLPAGSCSPFFEVEVGSEHARSFARSAARETGASALSRSPSYQREPLLRQVLEPFGYIDELRVTCLASGVCWGAISLWRRPGDGCFVAVDEHLLDEVAGQLGEVLRASVVASMTRSAHATRRHGIVVFDSERVIEVSPEASLLLGLLDTKAVNRYQFLEYLRRRASVDPQVSLLLTSEEGQWFSADAYPLDSPGCVAVVLSDATPTDLMKTLIAAAGLTGREVQVALLICRGSSDADIARSLSISTHTAQDHVKSIRAKLGVSSRSAIAARLFADYYFTHLLETASIGGRHGTT